MVAFCNLTHEISKMDKENAALAMASSASISYGFLDKIESTRDWGNLGSSGFISSLSKV